MPPKSANVGGQNPEFVLREFQGMNTINSRDTIDDNEFAWCENAIPVAPGALYPVPGPSTSLVTIPGEGGAPSYTINFNVTGTNYCFAVWANSGNGYVVNLTLFTAAKIITGLTSGQTQATQYSNQGLLIIDPTGYWDWNITVPNTLTPQNNAISGGTITTKTSVPGGTTLTNSGLTGGGTGGSAQVYYQAISVTVNAAGTGYVVGDSLTLTDGTAIDADYANIIVASVGSGGTITGITLASGGSYAGPVTGSALNTGPSGNVVSGGTGTGATFKVTVQATSVNVIDPGFGYTNGATSEDKNGATVVTTYTIATSGVIGGTSICTYAGRVWIGLGRVVNFTDVSSYNSFGGAGGSFTITDSYLNNNINALCAANNYMYIFGDDSIDALSNVTVTSGVTSFSRINVTTSVGTSVPTSVFSYYRGIAFYHASGFYLMAGATPEKISEKISGIITQIQPTALVYGAQVLVQSELCLVMLFTFFDVFTEAGVERTLMALFFRGRWWVASLNTLGPVQAIFSISPTAVGTVPGVATLYAWVDNSLYREKQSINAALAAQWNGVAGNVSITVDTELGSSTAAPIENDPIGYVLAVQAANEGGSQYLGLTIAGSTDISQIRAIALRGKTERDFLQ
jgi:hypothetical protein